jgi:hypothetical protein
VETCAQWRCAVETCVQWRCKLNSRLSHNIYAEE